MLMLKTFRFQPDITIFGQIWSQNSRLKFQIKFKFNFVASLIRYMENSIVMFTFSNWLYVLIVSCTHFFLGQFGYMVYELGGCVFESYCSHVHYFCSQRKYPLCANLVKKKEVQAEICYLDYFQHREFDGVVYFFHFRQEIKIVSQLTLGMKISLNMQNSMVILLTFPASDQKCSFWANLFKKIKTVS